MIRRIFRTRKIGVSHHTQLRRNFILEITEQIRGRDGLKKNNLLTKEMRVELPHPVFTLPHCFFVRVVAPCNLHEWDAAASKDSLLSVQKTHQVLLQGQAVVKLQTCVVEHVRGVDDVFPEH